MAAVSHRNIFARYWHGEGRLAPLYWLWGVAGSFVLAALVAGPPLAGQAGLGWALAGIAFGAVYTVWILVSIWRCARNIVHPAPLGVPREAWAGLARALTVGWAINAAGMSMMLIQALVERGAPLG
jgi:hypothetical protein